MREMDLKAACLAEANLIDADLRGADLTETILHSTHLLRTNLAGATLKSTVFAECLTLHKAVGLEEIRHEGPSSLDKATLRACVAYLPDVFLVGIGYSDEEIQVLRSLYPGP